jgi:hypothetical protein
METEFNHQSESMNTIVETFIIEETKELIYDNEQLDKWNKHVEELGLKGQTKIISKEKSPIPFMHLKKGMVNMFNILCPKTVTVEEYDVTPIPVEILDLIALSKRENYFKRLEIWYDEATPDPVCVGIINEYYCYDSGYSTIKGLTGLTKEAAEKAKQDNPLVRGIIETNVRHYLLGKWADVKHSFSELREIAKQRVLSEKMTEYKKQEKTIKTKIDSLT